MIGILARTRTNAVALAVLAALVGALFVALQPASAAALGPCAANPDITLGFGDTCTIKVTDLDKMANAASIDNPTVNDASVLVVANAVVAEGELTITAGEATGTATVTITKPDADTTDGETNVDGTARDESSTDDVATYTVNVAGFAITKVAVEGDEDNVVPAGPVITVTATVRSAESDNQVMLTVPTTGLSIQGSGTAPGAGTTQSQTPPTGTPSTGTVTYKFMVNTAGAPVGPYTLTFTADRDGFSADDNVAGGIDDGERVTRELEITIGDPGTGLSSATLSLGNKVNDLPYTDKDETVPESGTATASDGMINLVIQAFDSNGGKSNPGAINQIIVIAPGGDIDSNHNTGAGTEADPTTAGGSSSATLNEQDAVSGSAPVASTVGQRTGITVSKTDKKPGSVTVYAIVSGPGGAARTDEVTLTFSGPPTSLMVADASEALRSVNELGDDPDTDPVEDDFVIQDTVKLLVTAEDAGGNSATPPTGASVVITDPDGKRVGDERIEDSWPTGAAADGKRYLVLSGKGTSSAALKAGEYMVKVTSGKLEATAMFAVSGAAGNVALMVDNDAPSGDDEFVTATATVTDATGNLVADGTSVTFTASGNGQILFNTDADGKATTKNGVAKATFVVVGPGRAVVSAIAGSGRDAEAVVSTVGAVEPEAMPEEEASVSCLSNLSAFSTWTCGVDSSASEVFAMLEGRGVTAIHLHNGSAWVRYSVVEGNTVPGSSDFMVTEDDILYISN